jgi:hypothetical protein
LVLVPVSSMKTKLRLGVYSTRAAATSGRSCLAARTLFLKLIAWRLKNRQTEPVGRVLALIEQTELDLSGRVP